MDCLPDCLYYYFRDYLSQDDYQQLLNTSKKIFSDLRRKTIIYRLTTKYSIKYCEDESFRHQLLRKVENPSKQIIIKLSNLENLNHKELFDLVPVYLIYTTFPDKKTPTPMQYIKELTLREDDENIPFLDLSQCVKVTYQRCDNITSLGKERSLSITNNPRLSDIMNFHSIRTLIFEDCRNLVDISPLHGVYDLSLRESYEFTDISSLGGHHRLEISKCHPKLSGYHVLGDIPIVKLVGCAISDVSVLSNAEEVCLDFCFDLVDVSALKGVRDLTLSECDKIEDISMLTTVPKLTLCRLRNLKKYEGINQMRNLSLHLVNDLLGGECERFPNAKSIECLYISLDIISPFLPSFTNLHSLSISSAEMYCLKGSVDIHTVILKKCYIGSFRGLGKNRVVQFINCSGGVLDASPLATVSSVSIIDCSFTIEDLMSLKNVPRLKISQSS